MNKPPDKIAKELDEWAKGFVLGIVAGMFLMAGLIWAALEKL